MTIATLRALQAIIAEGIDEIEKVYADSSADADVPSVPLDYPSLDLPGDPESSSEKLATNPTVLAASSRAIAAASQLATILKTPFSTLSSASYGHYLPACLRFFEATHIPELLREHGKDGMHAEAIGQSINVDASRTSHILRLLATHHILREVKPDFFSLNRVSALLDSGKTFDSLMSNTGKSDKYEGPGQNAAYFAVNTEEIFKSSAYMTDFLVPAQVPRSLPSTLSDNGSPAGPDVSGDKHTSYQSAFNLAHRTHASFWEWLELPGNEERFSRFSHAMGGQGWEGAAMDALCGEPFPSLIPGSLVVDVGGGLGDVTMRLAQEFPSLRFLVQDRAPVCQQGEKMWRANKAQSLDSKQVQFQVHDFFDPQPSTLGPVSAFLLRNILHDWPDAAAAQILRRLRDSASIEASAPTYLVIGEQIVPYAYTSERPAPAGESKIALNDAEVAESGDDALCVPGASWPLLANLGMASAHAYWMDITMQVMFNACERTLPEFVALCSSAGWEVVAATRVPGSTFGQLVAKAAALPA